MAGLYGFERSLVAGWIAHLTRGSPFGAVFAALLADPGLYRVSEWVRKTVIAGVVYGLVLVIVGAGIVVPVWPGVVGASMATSTPNVTVPLLVWHAVYGLVLGDCSRSSRRWRSGAGARRFGRGPPPSSDPVRISSARM